ncbi:MAG: ABC transporter permease [Treponema sp.]|nr:ABC transporter permease [Treponema sp.]
MTFRSSALFAFRLIFPRTGKKSSARRSIAGAIICIGISLVPLVVVMSFADGMIGGMTQRIIGLSTCELKSIVRSMGKYGKSYSALKEYADTLETVDGVVAAYPHIACDGLAAGKNYRTGANIRAVEPDIFMRNPDYKKLFKLCSGSYDSFVKNEKSAVLGERIASLLNVKPGDSFRVIMTKSSPDGRVSPVVTAFSVAAVISSGYQELDSLWIFIPIKTGFTVLPPGSRECSVLIKTENGVSSDLPRIKKQCVQLSSGIGRVYSWDQLNRSKFQMFSSSKVMLTFVMLLIVLVASVNISSALVMLVMERRKEIAILKSVGATNSGISISFLIAGVSCGLLGTVIGLPVGVMCAINSNLLISSLERLVNLTVKFFYVLGGNSLEGFEAVQLLNPAYYLTEIPVSIPFGELFLIASSVILLSLVVSVVPAVKAGKERPLETFRKS